MQIKLGRYQVGNIWKSQQDVFKLLVSQFRRYHNMEIQDVYKLFYQSINGSAHILQSSIKVFEDQFLSEYEKTEADEAVPLWESIHPEGKIVRINMAAYKNRSENVGRLITLCVWSADVMTKEKDAENLENAMFTFYRLCKSRKIPKYDPIEVEEFLNWVRENSFPSMHHSDTYRAKYDPHYRLLHREFLSILI